MASLVAAEAGGGETARRRVLIVDDDLDTSDQLGKLLDGEGYTCERAASGMEALATIANERPFDAVVSDVKMAGMSGLDLLDRLNELHPLLPVILCTGFSALSGAVDATKRGAFQYLQKPYDFAALEQTLDSAIRERRSARPTKRPLALHAPPLLLGSEPAMATLLVNIASVAASCAPVLIQGETGTGKDVVARAIHAAGPRRDRPFVAINVAAIPEHLLESELFGHVRGAFTGASGARRGLFLEAEGGTLFLDEIGDMPVGLQSKLLRVLQFGEVRPVGADTARHLDVRIVAATHRDLTAQIAAGRFREDLYFRIRVLPLGIPPLRKRRGDIAVLARHFLASALGRTPSSPVRDLDAEAEQILTGAPWPGNVRELESTMERLVVFGRSATLGAADLQFLQDLPTAVDEDEGLVSLRHVSERHVARILDATGGDKRRAAEILGIDLSTLYRWKQRRPVS